MVTVNLHHVAVIVTDLERSAAFYQELFGLRQIERPPFSISGMWLGVGALQVHLTVYPEGNFRKGLVNTDDTHFAFNTADFEGFVARAKEMGFKEEAAEDDPLRLIVRRRGAAGFPQVYLIDPDHNIIEVNGAPRSA